MYNAFMIFFKYPKIFKYSNIKKTSVISGVIHHTVCEKQTSFRLSRDSKCLIKITKPWKAVEANIATDSEWIIKF